jgi:hypothetical protein
MSRKGLLTFRLVIVSFAVIAFTNLDPTSVIIGAEVIGALFL